MNDEEARVEMNAIHSPPTQHSPATYWPLLTEGRYASFSPLCLKRHKEQPTDPEDHKELLLALIPSWRTKQTLNPKP